MKQKKNCGQRPMLWKLLVFYGVGLLGFLGLCTPIKGAIMPTKTIQAVVLAAGRSTRFNTETSKLATKICGQEMILFCTKLLAQLDIPTTLVVGYKKEVIQEIVTRVHKDTVTFALQEEQKGTGHAVLCSQETWNAENILIMNGDGPLVTADILENLITTHEESNAAITFVTAHNPDPSIVGYGRVITSGDDIQIVEHKHFTGDPQEHCCLNAGLYLINTAYLKEAIGQLQENEITHEWYLTDLIHLANTQGRIVKTVDAPFDYTRGVNTLKELWAVEQVMRADIISEHMQNGVRFATPQTAHIDLDVSIGTGSVIGCSVHLLNGSTLGKNCTIDSFSTLDNAHLADGVHILQNTLLHDSRIEQGARIGPFAHVRDNSLIKQMAIIGNFVEVAKSSVGENSKAKHLSYLGQAQIGNKVNIGAGTITCNYDGISKQTTTVKDGSFIGSNNTLIAPVTIGQEAYTAGGSVITDNVPDGALAIGRERQTNKEGYTKKIKQRKSLSQESNKKKTSFMGAFAKSDAPFAE